MAKQLVSPIERHLEKGVVGLAGLILVGAIARYLVTTPNQIELGQESVTPATIDAKLAQKAADVRSRMQTAQPKTVVPEPLFNEFAKSVAPVERNPLPLAVALHPEVPIIDKAYVAKQQTALMKIDAPGKPAVSHGRSTVNLVQAGAVRRTAVDWATIGAVFDIKAHSDRQRREYGATKADVIFGKPEAQRRARRPDGSWNDSDWNSVDHWPSSEVPREDPIVLTIAGDRHMVEPESEKRLLKYTVDLRTSRLQLEILRPLFVQSLLNGDRWLPPPLVSKLDLWKQDDEFLNPDNPPAAQPVDRYGIADADEKPKEPPKAMTPADQIRQALEDVPKIIAKARQNRSENEAREAYNKAAEVMQTREATASDRSRAEKLMKDAEQAERDIKRELLAGGPAPGADRAGGAAAPVKPRRDPLPAQVTWVHDARPGSLVSGKTYQYRLRYRVLNPGAGRPEKFENPENAAVLFLTSDWSPPSDPVTITPSSYYFLASEDKGKEQILVEFYRWFEGVWVKSSRVRFGIGNAMAEEQRVAAPDLLDASKADNPMVRFEADAVVLDVDFLRNHRERKAGNSPRGVRFAPPSATTAAVFLDSSGALEERVWAVDKDHPTKKSIELYKPPRNP